jgi:hypothetical protein
VGSGIHCTEFEEPGETVDGEIIHQLLLAPLETRVYCYGAKAPNSRDFPLNSQLKLTAIDIFYFPSVFIYRNLLQLCFFIYCRWLQHAFYLLPLASACFLFIAVGFSQRIEGVI